MSALQPFSNATVIFQIPTATLVTDPATGNQRPVIDPVPVRAFLKFKKVTEAQTIGAVQVETIFSGRATAAIPAAVVEATPVRLQLDGESTIWVGVVQSLRAPFGAGGIGATVSAIAGEAIEIAAWKQP